MGYLLGYHFPVGVHIAHYHGDLWDGSGKVTVGLAGDAKIVDGWVNVTDAVAC